jgi:diguanylate cyclase (GGDEF)-like protein
MRRIFRPASALVGRLRYAHKFAVVGLVLLLPLSFVAQAYVGLQRSRITFSAKERVGVAYLVPLLELTGDLVEARHLAVTRRAGDSRGPTLDVAAVDRVDERHGAALDTTGHWIDAKRRLARAAEAGDPRTAFDLYNDAADALLALIVHVGDQSNLTLDPDLDTYYLMDALQFRLPAMLDVAGRMADRALLARRDLVMDPTAVLIDLGLNNGALSSMRDAVDRGLDTGSRHTDSAELRRLAGPGFSRLDRETSVLLGQVTTAIRTRSVQDVEPATANAVRAEAGVLARAVAAELDALLAVRISGFEGSARRVQALFVVTALLAIYLFVGFFLSVSTPVRRMVTALRAVASGDLSASVDVGTRDELHFVGQVLNDTIAQTRAVRDRLAHQATHDLLTGLPNRALVLDRLEEGVARARRGEGLMAVLFIDLDRFKLVNDSLGHEAGDELLRAVASRICAVVRPGDTVGRLAGDEFVVICERVHDRDEPVVIAQHIAAAVAEPVETHEAGGEARLVEVGASIGITFAGPGSGSDPDGLLRDADMAMYRAKQRGRGRVEIFDETLRVAVQRRMQTQEDLRRAIAEGELSLHYQPIVDAVTGKVHSVEALARWRHPARGMLPPAEFIPIAEETGLIVPLGAWVLAEACRQVTVWRAAHTAIAALNVSVNLSARQLADAELVPTVSSVLAGSGLPSEALWLEITESTVMADAESARRTLADLRRLGVHIAIDDFGTGYSSLAYLRRFPVEVLKIDRSFVRELGQNPEDEAIVGTVVSLARILGLGVVAEGVETAAQAAELRRLGCHTLQGYGLGRPLPAEEAWAALLAQVATLAEMSAPGAGREDAALQS